MEEVCQICNRVFGNKKALGGHMRVHFIFSKTTFQQNTSINNFNTSMNLSNITTFQEIAINNSNTSMNLLSNITDFQENGINNSNTTMKLLSNITTFQESTINNSNTSMKLLSNIATFQENGIKNSSTNSRKSKSSHELRDSSPKETSRFAENGVSFSCKICGKCFHTKRSLSGHMKVHPRKSRILGSDLGTRKRPKIEHGVSTEFYGLNEYCSVGYEVREVERAAECLVMLSTGFEGGVGLDWVTESSDDGADYVGGGNDSERSLSSGNLDFSDGFDCKLDTRDETKVSFDASGDLSHGNDNVKKHEWLNGAPIKLHCGSDTMESDSLRLTVLGEAVSEILDSGSCGKSSVRVQYSGLKRKYSEKAGKTLTGLKNQRVSNVDQLNFEKDGVVRIKSLNSSKKTKEYECPVCFKVFSSGQAMGGHKRAHFVQSKSKEETYVKQETDKINDYIDLNFPIAIEGAKDDHRWWVESGNRHTDSQVKSVALSLN